MRTALFVSVVFVCEAFGVKMGTAQAVFFALAVCGLYALDFWAAMRGR